MALHIRLAGDKQRHEKCCVTFGLLCWPACVLSWLAADQHGWMRCELQLMCLCYYVLLSCYLPCYLIILYFAYISVGAWLAYVNSVTGGLKASC